VFWGAEMNRQRIPENLRVPAYRIAPAGVLMLISVGMFLAAGLMVQATRDAADSLVNVTDYQHAVLGDDLADAVGIPAPQDS
jgi:NADH-ubiquinone/plastoquinone (complex I) family protein